MKSLTVRWRNCGAVLILILASCGGEGEQSGPTGGESRDARDRSTASDRDGVPSPEGALEDPGSVPVEAQRLKIFLPDTLPGGEERSRIDESLSDGSLPQVPFRWLELYGRYSGGITVRMDDFGTMPAETIQKFYRWMFEDVDKEDEKGTRKSFLYQGRRAIEMVRVADPDWGRGEWFGIAVRVGSRFMVEVSGDALDRERTLSILESIDLAGIESLE